MKKQLYRSSNNKMLAGVCGGLGDYFDLDPTLVRLVAVVAIFASGGMALLAYLVGWVIMPEGYSNVDIKVDDTTESMSTNYESTEKHRSGWHIYLPGILLIAFGVILLLKHYVYWFSFGDIWPIILIIVGTGLILYRGTSRNNGNNNYTEQQATNSTTEDNTNGGTI